MTRKLTTAASLMPTDIDTLQLLQIRADKLAQPLPLNQQDNEQTYNYLHFKLNKGENYGIPEYMLHEVIYVKHLTALPWLPAFIVGIVSWKGIILTVLDSNYLYAKKSFQAIDTESRIIVVGNHDKKIGLLVNSVLNFSSYNVSDLQTRPQKNMTTHADYILGLLDSSIILMNIDAILTDTTLEIL